MLLVVLVVSAVTQINFLNRSLQRFDSREVVPTQFVLFTLSAIIGSAILYREFEEVALAQALNFFFGTAVIFCGVFRASAGLISRIIARARVTQRQLRCSRCPLADAATFLTRFFLQAGASINRQGKA